MPPGVPEAAVARAYSGAGAAKGKKAGPKSLTRRRRTALAAGRAFCWRGLVASSLRLQRGDARLERLVLLARQARHLLDRLEFLALDHVEVAQERSA